MLLFETQFLAFKGSVVRVQDTAQRLCTLLAEDGLRFMRTPSLTQFTHFTLFAVVSPLHVPVRMHETVTKTDDEGLTYRCSSAKLVPQICGDLWTTIHQCSWLCAVKRNHSRIQYVVQNQNGGDLRSSEA